MQNDKIIIEGIDATSFSPAVRKILQQRELEERNAKVNSIREKTPLLEQIWADINNHCDFTYRQRRYGEVYGKKAGRDNRVKFSPKADLYQSI